MSFPTALNHVIYLKQFLMNKGFTDVVEDLLKVESKLEREFVKQQQRATQTSKLSSVKTWFYSSNLSLVQLSNFVIYLQAQNIKYPY